MVVVAPQRWDEACFSVPAVRALVASGVSVTVLCPETQNTFWQVEAGIRVLAYPVKSSVRSIAALLGSGNDVAIIWEAGEAADACAKAGIAKRTGPGGDKALTKRLTDPLPVPAPAAPVHRVRHYLSVVEAMGLDTRVPSYFEPAVFDVPRISGSVLLVPDSDYGRSHEWPIDRWESVAREWLAAGKQIHVGAIPGGALAAQLLSRLGSSALSAAIPSWQEACVTLAAFEQVVAADGSLPHLAAYAGATCSVLFGPNEPVWRRPLGRQHSIVRKKVECSPCFLAKCPLDHRCMQELPVERVLAALP